MTHIQTHSHAVASLFQSLAEDVARRIDQKKGTASAERRHRRLRRDPR